MTGNYVIEYGLTGKVIEVSEEFLHFLGCKLMDLVGRHHKDIIRSALKDDDAYEVFWQDLLAGKTRDEVNNLRFGGKEYKIFETYIPKRNSKGYVSKIVSYIDVFINDNQNKHDVIRKAENDLVEKSDIREKMLNISNQQNELMEKLKKIRERNAARMKELDDSLGQSF